MTESHEQRIERILRKLKEVRRQELTCFGGESHKFTLNPRIDDQALNRFEADHNITLPLGAL